MKKLIKTITVAFTAAFILTTNVSAQEPRSLVVFGDSITSGYGLEGYASGNNTSADESFPNMLADRFSLSYGESYVNYAVDGMTTAELLTRISQEDGKLSLQKADSVIISIGGNDFLRVFMTIVQEAALANADAFIELGIEEDLTTMQGVFTALSQAFELDDGAILKELALTFSKPETAMKFTGTAKTAIENASAIMTAIYAANPEINAYILTVYNPFEELESFESVSALADLVLNALNRGYAELAEEVSGKGYSMTVVDVYSLFAGKSTELTNIAYLDIHPNTDGHSAIYTALYNAFTANKSNVNSSESGNESPSGNEAVTPTTEKGSPDTGIGGTAAVIGIAILAAAVFLNSRKKR